MSKAKIYVFRKGRFLAANEVWRYDDKEIEDINSYKSLELNFSTRLFELLLLEGGGGGILYWTVPLCGIFCIELCVTLCQLVGHFVLNCVTLCHLVGHFVLNCVTLCHLVGHFVLDCVLHCSTVCDILY